MKYEEDSYTGTKTVISEHERIKAKPLAAEILNRCTVDL
jgi:hypothetical protein